MCIWRVCVTFLRAQSGVKCLKLSFNISVYQVTVDDYSTIRRQFDCEYNTNYDIHTISNCVISTSESHTGSVARVCARGLWQLYNVRKNKVPSVSAHTTAEWIWNDYFNSSMPVEERRWSRIITIGHFLTFYVPRLIYLVPTCTVVLQCFNHVDAILFRVNVQYSQPSLVLVSNVQGKDVDSLHINNLRAGWLLAKYATVDVNYSHNPHNHTSCKP